MSPEENERLTRVGPATPAGKMLRRYWWPVGFSEQLERRPLPVRILGEDLILYRAGRGCVGLLDRRCAHRGASLALGRVEADGLRCCYHGWKFDAAGRCIDMPAEPANTPLKDEVRQPAYRTQEAAGLVFAYLGPEPAPLLPRYDLLFRDNCSRHVGAFVEHCNWMQRAENAVDQMHSTVLHATVYPEIALQRPRGVYERVEDGWWGLASREQDRAAQESQGPIVDRSRETLATQHGAGLITFDAQKIRDGAVVTA